MKNKNILIEHFANEFGITVKQARKLSFLALQAAIAQERVHNSNAPMLQKHADESCNAFEHFAIEICKFDGVDWPGLYPTVSKGEKKYIAIPHSE